MKARESIQLQRFEDLVNVFFFFHDLRPQLHMFLSEVDRLLSASPAVFAQETDDNVSPAESERLRKLDSSSPLCRKSRFGDEFEAVASASRLSCLDEAHG